MAYVFVDGKLIAEDDQASRPRGVSAAESEVRQGSANSVFDFEPPLGVLFTVAQIEALKAEWEANKNIGALVLKIVEHCHRWQARVRAHR